MNKFLASLLILLLTYLPLNCFAVSKYTLDPDHSSIIWSVNHFGFSNITGKVRAEGSLTLDKNHLQNSKVFVIFHLENLVTGISNKFDADLKSSKFFDIQRYPTATFVSTQVEPIGDKKIRISGILTLHGKSKPVVLTVLINKIGNHPFYNKMAAGFSGVAQLKRSDFGMGEYTPWVGDNVLIYIEVEALAN